MRWFAACVLISAGLAGPGCSRGSGGDREGAKARGDLLTQAPSGRPVLATLMERSGSGRADYLGFRADPAGPVRPGAVIELTHWFVVTAPFTGTYRVFVHGDLPGEGGRVLTADHDPIKGLHPTSSWKPGDVWVDRHKVRIPDQVSGTHIEVWAGLFAGNQRLTVRAKPGVSDGRDRIRAGRIAIQGGGAVDLPQVTIPVTTATITPDGVLDEAAWKQAVVLTFADSMGRDTKVRYPTRLRLLYDARHLYVAFEATDADVSCPYSKRDDPIYDHEAVELFMMPNVAAPAVGPYIELQASPKGVIFDAAFIARRTGMDTSFNGRQTVGTKIDGTLNVDDGSDRGFVSEWVVPWRGLRGVNEAPKAGDEWRMNAFRIEKFRVGGKIRGEFTAWSPPRVGDFHNVARFGRMIFGR